MRLTFTRVYRILMKLWQKFKDFLSYYFDEPADDTLHTPREVRDMPPSEIVSRAEWGAREPRELIEDLDIPVTAVVFHHTKTPQCFSQEECSQVIRQIQTKHMDLYGWQDIGYNFLVGGDARVYEGRGWTKVGSHTDQWNERSIGVAAIGDFKDEPPSEEMLTAIEQLVGTGLKQNKYLRHDYSALGHNQLDIVFNNYVCTCPGDAFYEEVKYMPHWTIGGLYIEAEEVTTDSWDSLNTTPYYFTGENDSPSDFTLGYDRQIYGPYEPNEQN